ncbi:MAG: hypothetical protein QXW73_09215, partial [Nitrososphaerales archaeon]
QNEKLDELTKRILTGNFTSEEERNQLLRDTVKTGVEESVRIFIAALIDPYIASSKMDGIVNDFSAGVTSRFTLIDARIADKNNLKVGVKQIYQGAWNPIGGFRDVYANRIWMGIADPGTFRNPYTGDVTPIRTTWQVVTAGPNGELDVPPDAIIWDAVNEKWSNVGSNVNAISKVTYDVTYSKWHNGVMMDKNDILYSIYFTFEWGQKEGDNDPTFDSEYTSQLEQLLPTIKGIKFLSDSRVEAYIDFWHYDQGEIADYFGAWSTMPWEILASMEKVVIDGNGAFSKADADSKSVDWLSLIISSNANKVKDALTRFKQENFVPKALQGSVNVSDAQARYDATIKWIDEKRHAVISNGPFYLQSYNPEARTITIKAFRDTSYPFEVGKWREFEEPRVATIGSVNTPLSIKKGEAVTMSGDVKGKSDPRDVQLYFFMKNSENKVVVKGMTKPSSDGKFQIQLSKDDTSKLSTGSNQLKLFAISNVALKPDVYTTSIIGVPSEIGMPSPPPLDAGLPSKQNDVSVAIKHTKKITLVALKNNDKDAINGFQIKINDGTIRYVKAREWDRSKIDQSTVLVQTLDRPLGTGKSMIVLLIVDNKQSSFEWSVLDKDSNKLATGVASVRQ